MKVVVVGGGWSGLAAAVKLSENGHHVHLIESAKYLGGRARSVDWQGLEIDNGQHLLIGAYKHTRQLLNVVGVDERDVFNHQALNIQILDTTHPPLTLAAGSGLWPVSLLWRLFRDNDMPTLWQIIMLSIRARVFPTERDRPLAAWLEECGQSNRLIRQLWEPLCLATLNTPIDEASAAVFARVINDTFRSRADTDLLIPLKPLGQVFPSFAADYIQAQGGQVSLQQRVTNICISNQQATAAVLSDGTRIAADHIILATPLDITRQLITPHLTLPHFDTYPIATVFLRYAERPEFPYPMLGLSGTLSQWIFDRSDVDPGLVTVVISGPGPHERFDKHNLCVQIAREVMELVPFIDTMPIQSWVIREKKATFSCGVDIQSHRPKNRTEITSLWLAGDYVSNDYPATLEGAILNGVETANLLMDEISVHH